MIQRHVLQTRATALAERRQVKVVASTEMRGRDGIVMVSAGIDLEWFKKNPIILWQHDPDRPIARAATISVEGTDLVMTAQFPPAGASALADEIFELIQAGIVSAASTGFESIAAEPDGRDGMRITKCELQEVSFVSIPALPNALVSERKHTAKPQPTSQAVTSNSRHMAKRLLKNPELFALASVMAAELAGGDVEGDGRLRTVRQLGCRLQAIGEAVGTLPAASTRRGLSKHTLRSARYEMETLLSRAKEPRHSKTERQRKAALYERELGAETKPLVQGSTAWWDAYYAFRRGA